MMLSRKKRTTWVPPGCFLCARLHVRASDRERQREGRHHALLSRWMQTEPGRAFWNPVPEPEPDPVLELGSKCSPARFPGLSCGRQSLSAHMTLFYLGRNTKRSGPNGSITAGYRSGLSACFPSLCWISSCRPDESPRSAADEEEEEERCLLFLRQY